MMAPRFKKGDKSNLSNFRPVSTIVEVGKLCEMAAHDQVRDHFLLHDLFHPGHHGGIPKLDTTTALLQVQKYTHDAAEAKKITGTVLLDQSSAFDLVDHQILLAKLEAYLFEDNALEWFRDYLSDRSFRVRIESKSSSPHETGPFGVPQGSVLGNLLFIVSQNDLPDATEVEDGGQCVCFVDDETEQVSDANPVTLQTKLQHRVDNAVEWLTENMMIISPDKSKLIVSMTRELRAARHPNLAITININGTVIPATPSEKLLGITISQDMTWGPYLWGETWRNEKNEKGLIPSLLQRLALLRHLIPYSSKTKMRSFVPALLISKIRYALPLYGSIWGLSGYNVQEPQKSSFTKYDISRLQSIQRKAALMTLPSNTDLQCLPTADILHQVKWQSVHQMIANSTLTLMIRIMRYDRPESFAVSFTDTGSSRTRSNKIIPPRSKLNISLEGFTNQSIRLFNMLPSNISDDLTQSNLKSLITRWITENMAIKV